MATMDLIKYAGFEPANSWLVVLADAKRWNCISYYLKDPVKLILINTFEVSFVANSCRSRSWVDAYKNMGDATKHQSLFCFQVPTQ
jgi:succinyl-CoA synthetase beta subunit